MAESGERDAKSAVRTVQILERLAEGDAPTLAELARDLDAPKSSIHVVVQTLIRRGWVQRDNAGRLAIGVRAVRVGTAFVDGDPVVALTAPVLDALVAELDETVHLGRLDGTDIVYLAKRESTQQLRLFSAVGRRLPAYTTALGKALLAGLPDDQLDDHLPVRLQPMTEATITDRRQLRTSLAEIRERGWSSDEGENAVGIACVAVPLPLAEPPARRAVVLGAGDALRPGSPPRHVGCVDAGTRHDCQPFADPLIGSATGSGLDSTAVGRQHYVHHIELRPRMWTPTYRAERFRWPDSVDSTLSW